VREKLKDELANDIAYFKQIAGTQWIDHKPAGVALSWLVVAEQLLKAVEWMQQQAQGMMNSFGMQVAGSVAAQAECDELQRKLRAVEEENALLKARGKGLN
jgi:hypothetical protein